MAPDEQSATGIGWFVVFTITAFLSVAVIALTAADALAQTTSTSTSTPEATTTTSTPDATTTTTSPPETTTTVGTCASSPAESTTTTIDASSTTTSSVPASTTTAPTTTTTTTAGGTCPTETVAPGGSDPATAADFGAQTSSGLASTGSGSWRPIAVVGLLLAISGETVRRRRRPGSRARSLP